MELRGTQRDVPGTDGRLYSVSIEWLPHGRRIFRKFRDRRRDNDAFDPSAVQLPDTDGGFDADFGGDDLVVGIVIVLGVVVLGFLLWWLILPALFLLLDLLLIVLLVIGGAALKTVFRRPWTVAVRQTGSDTVIAKGGVVGWKAAGRARDAVVESLRSGADPRTAVAGSGLVAV